MKWKSNLRGPIEREKEKEIRSEIEQEKEKEKRMESNLKTLSF